MKKPFYNPLPTEEEINEAFEQDTDHFLDHIGGDHFTFNIAKLARALHHNIAYNECVLEDMTHSGPTPLSYVTHLNPVDHALMQEVAHVQLVQAAKIYWRLSLAESSEFDQEGPPLKNFVNSAALPRRDEQEMYEAERRMYEKAAAFASDASGLLRGVARIHGKPNDIERNLREEYDHPFINRWRDRKPE